MGTVLAVISGKGGTGKTSLCAGIASCLAADSLRVLCIDADLGLRNLDISLGMSQEAVLPFTAVMRGEYELQQAAESAVIPNLYLLTAPVTELPEGIDPAQFGALLETARASSTGCSSTPRRAWARALRWRRALRTRPWWCRTATRLPCGTPRTRPSFFCRSAPSPRG